MNKLLRLPDVISMTGLGRDSIYRLGREGRFPKPRKITGRSSAWLASEVQQWIDTRPVKAGADAAVKKSAA